MPAGDPRKRGSGQLHRAGKYNMYVVGKKKKLLSSIYVVGFPLMDNWIV